MRERLGIKGWILTRGSNFERYLYTLQRITGLGIVLFLFMHIIVTSILGLEIKPWHSQVKAFIKSPVAIVLEFCIISAIVFHAINGIRLALLELGFFIGKARRPIYPYVPESLVRPRALLTVLMILIAVVILLGAYGLFSKLIQ